MRGHVEACGGQFVIDSVRGQGTRVSGWLPVGHTPDHETNHEFAST